MSKVSEMPVPVFKLYGEITVWPTPDLIHCESIASRSQLHGWEIKPHRHCDLVQLLYIRSGQATLKVEDVTHQIQAPVLQVVPALSVHTFKFSEDVQGEILSLVQPLADKLDAALSYPVLSCAACYSINEEFLYLDTIVSAISDEHFQQCSDRDSMLNSLITMLSIWLSRRSFEMSSPRLSQIDRGREHMQAFTRMLELRFCEHLPIEHYAVTLGITSAHLNVLCRRFSGHSALQIINQRLLLEAKRKLVYTTLTINQVSDSLGFSEPAYFSRFFKREAGYSPKQFRLQGK